MKRIEIKKNDIFKILDQRVQRSARMRKPEDFESDLFFNESIHVLKNIEFFVDNILNRVITSLSTYEEAVKNNDQKQLDKVHATFSALRFHRNMMKLPNVRFSDNFNIFKEIYINSEIIKKLQQRLRMTETTDLDELNLFNQSFFQIDDVNIAIDKNWNVDSFPKEKCFNGISKIQEQDERDYISRGEKRIERLDHLGRLYVSFDQLLEQLGSVYVLCVDVRFINHYQNRDANNFDNFFNLIYQQTQLVGNILQSLPNFVRADTKFEHDFHLGVNLHCILIFKHSPKFDEQDLVKQIQDLFDLNFRNQFYIQVRNWNEVVRKNFSNKAVGHIGKANLGKIEQFKYWILNYFYLVDDYIKLECISELNEQPYEINFTWFALTPAIPQVMDVVVANSKPVLKFQQLVTQTDEKKIWSTRHFSKKMKIYIELAELYYSEQFVANQEVKQYLLDFEIMAAMLQQNFEQPFLIPILPADQTLTDKELRKCLSLTGKRLLSLLKRSSLLDQLSLDDKKRNVGLNALSMFENLNFSTNALILHNSLNFLDAQTFNNLRYYWYELQNKTMNSIFLTSMHSLDFKLYFENNSDTLNLYLDHKQRVCDKRLASSQKYIQQLLSEDVYLLHVKLSCELHSGILTQDNLSKAFTNFLRTGKRAKPLKWLLGYLGLWQLDAHNNPYVDMYMFLERGCEKQVSHIEELLSEYWNNFITEKCTTFFGVPSTNIRHVSIELLPIYRSRYEYAESVLLIQAKDKNAHNFILETLIKFIVYRDLFQLDSQKDVPKALIKGSKTKTENFRSLKN
ncbi:hypothetical protein HXZ77_09710 [Acinetobacter johnsonii]|uniref:hypothetical protein n=1 Tax=Acinetobacter johnsonii TaxID=40214 RepID=UPI002574A732|nr:hypothetical protein [Acinetobacter johnsonii]MDM1251394.1 hypothetical protein [Acinetobacter johnsonii]